MPASPPRDLTLICEICGAYDIPSVPDRQPLVWHLDPTTEQVCRNRQATVMLLGRRMPPRARSHS